MQDQEIPFASPVVTEGLPGFPERLAGVSEARRAVEAARLPVARSCHAWVEASNRLLLAQVDRTAANVEAARIALVLAVAGEGCVPCQTFALAA